MAVSSSSKHTDSHSITGLFSCFIYQPLGTGLGSDSYLPAAVNTVWQAALETHRLSAAFSVFTVHSNVFDHDHIIICCLTFLCSNVGGILQLSDPFKCNLSSYRQSFKSCKVAVKSVTSPVTENTSCGLLAFRLVTMDSYRDRFLRWSKKINRHFSYHSCSTSPASIHMLIFSPKSDCIHCFHLGPSVTAVCGDLSQFSQTFMFVKSISESAANHGKNISLKGCEWVFLEKMCKDITSQ